MQRKFIPGSEWAYFKLYTGTKTADMLLINHISAFVDGLMADGVIDSFFFLRYSDPDFHIRLRLHLSDINRYNTLLSEFHSCFSGCADKSIVSKVLCDTYVREIERYGVETMSLSEEMFCIDSNAILKLLQFDESQIPRWQLAFLLADDLISAFMPNIDERGKFTLQLANSFKREFGFESSVYTKQLNDKYRLLRPQIERLMLRNGDIYRIYPILEQRKVMLSNIANKISAMNTDGITVTYENLLNSYIHMCLNRLFRSKNRLSEMVVYDCINRHYESVSAREKYSIK